MEGLNKRSLFEFLLYGVPDGATITNARVYFMTGDTVGNFPQNQTFSRVVTEWNESTVTWNNQPEVTAVNILVHLIQHNTGGAYMDFDVTLLVVDAFNNNKVFGLMLAFVEEDALPWEPGRAQMFYVSREGPYTWWRPYIIVEYE